MADDLNPNGNGNATAVMAEPTLRRARPASEPAELPAPVRPETPQRLLSLDAYRGLIMVTLAFTGFGLAGTARAHLGLGPSPFWQEVFYQFEHVEWTGCGYWDLIQPSFMFMVGVAMAFSYAKRQQTGQSYLGMLGHAMVRSFVLIMLGVYFTTRWELMNVLTQIGLGYTFLFLLWGRCVRKQAVIAVAILVGTWLLYVLYPYAGYDFEATPRYQDGKEVLSNGISRDWASKHLTDIGPAWHKNHNVGHAIDRYVLNYLPADREFLFNAGGYQTINFLPSLATMLFGLMCGELLRSRASSQQQKILILLAAGLGGLLVGQVLALTGICPLVKRIWTPSWALYSTGWCCLILMGFYGIIDVLGQRRWAFPLVVVGINSIAIYFMGQTLRGHTNRFWQGVASDTFTWVGPLYAPMLEATLTGMLFWLVCLWMYRQRIFVRI